MVREAGQGLAVDTPRQARLSSSCSDAVQTLFSGCSDAVQTLFSGCSDAVQTLFSGCLDAVQTLFSGWPRRSGSHPITKCCLPQRDLVGRPAASVP